jgi:predicted TIM-barrel fold metal-dependent hydrolase
LKKIRYDWMLIDRSILNRDHLPADLEPRMKACGVEQVVLMQSDNSLADSACIDAFAAVTGRNRC